MNDQEPASPAPPKRKRRLLGCLLGILRLVMVVMLSYRDRARCVPLHEASLEYGFPGSIGQCDSQEGRTALRRRTCGLLLHSRRRAGSHGEVRGGTHRARADLSGQVPEIIDAFYQDWLRLPAPANRLPAKRNCEESSSRIVPCSIYYMKRLASRARRSYPLDFSTGLDADNIHRKDISIAAAFLRYDYYLRCRAGNSEAALQSLLAIVRLGESLRNEPTVYAQLTRAGIFGSFSDILPYYLSYCEPSTEQLDQLAEELAAIDFLVGLHRACVGTRIRATMYFRHAANCLRCPMGGYASGFARFVPRGMAARRYELVSICLHEHDRSYSETNRFACRQH